MAIGTPVIGGNNANSATSVSRTHGSSVSVGDLVVIQGAKFSPSSDPFVLGDCTKTGGTATIGTIALDFQNSVDTGNGGVFASTAIWSCIVTGAGTLTMSVGGAPSGSYMIIGLSSVSGSWDGSRLEDSDGRTSTTNNATSESVPTMTCAGAAIAFAGLQLNTDGVTTFTPAGGWTTIYENESGTDDNGSFIYQKFASGGSIDASWTSSGATNDGYAASGAVYKEAADAVATLSSPTPSGTLGTSNTATIGASTDQSSGTLYVVVDSASNISGITAAQIKAGNNKNGTAAVAANSASVSTGSPSAGVTGLTAGTAYSYAIVQNNTNGDSNVITGTFTTASVLPTITSIGGDNSVFNGETSVTIVGTNFGASQGSGKVYLSPTDDVGSGSRVEQTVTAWSSTSITITVVKGGLSLDTNVYGFVVNNSSDSNAAGKVCQINSRPYVRDTLIDKNGAAAASVTGIVMLVWRADPTTGAPNPNEALTVSTNGSGQLNQLITRGSLAPGDPVWIALFKPGSPAKGTARKISPVYE